ncbi:MAG: hypothetical protein AAF652_16285 [Cyanobacteria bacterium P01_C01_bin.72]
MFLYLIGLNIVIQSDRIFLESDLNPATPMRKLLIILNAMMKNNQGWQP